MSRHPQLKWAEREDKIYITVLLSDAKDAKVNLEPDGVFTFSATAGSDNNLYEIKLNLFDKVNVEESKISIGTRSIFCIVEKAEKGWWTKLLSGSEKTPHYVKVDWDKWVDQDDDGAAAELDTGGMDFSQMGGGMGGMEGLGGMGGMGGLGGMMGGMGGMGGMDFSKLAGMGGGMEGMDFSKLGGMGGMGDEDDGDDNEDDDQDEEVAKPEVHEPTRSEPAISEEKVSVSPST